ncbi:DR2241 family protein [Halobacteriaceae archaeon GCM10025711]
MTTVTASDVDGDTTQGLVLVGHGSHRNPWSEAPVRDHARRLRAWSAFDEVRAALLFGDPSLRDVLRTVAADDVYVVPLFMSAGFFVDEVLPRELADWSGTVTCTDPVGTHDAVTDLVVSRAMAALDDADPAEVTLGVVGHGTSRNPDSADAVRGHVERIRDDGRFAAVRSAFLDDDPGVGTLFDRTPTDRLVVVPLFAADGLHSRRDVHAALATADDRVQVADAVGTDPNLAVVVVDRATAAGATARPHRTVPNRPTDAERAFLAWLERGDDPPDERYRALVAGVERTFGELAVRTSLGGPGGREYAVRHRADRERPPGALVTFDDPTVARRVTKLTDHGHYRPLATARSLPTGWAMTGLGPAALLRTLDAIYPGAIRLWHRERTGDLSVTDYETATARRTGRLAVAADLEPDDVTAVADACCRRCIKTPTWDASPDRPLDVTVDGDVPCPEPCSVFVEAAATVARSGSDANAAVDSVLAPDEPAWWRAVGASVTPTATPTRRTTGRTAESDHRTEDKP